MVLHGEVEELDLYNSKFFNAKTNQVIPATSSVIFQFLLYRYFFIVGVIILMGTMGLLLTLFLGFHVYIASNGMTTNEFYKWRNLRKWHGKCCKYWRIAREKGEGVSTCQEKGVKWNFSFGRLHFSRTTEVKNDKAKDNTTTSTTTTTSSKTTIKNINLPARDILYIQENDEIIILHPGEVPKNIYDNGFVNNWKDVLFPRSIARRDALKKDD